MPDKRKKENMVPLTPPAIGRVVAVSISDRKGVKKKNTASGRLGVDFGLQNDAHAGKWHRQKSI